MNARGLRSLGGAVGLAALVAGSSAFGQDGSVRNPHAQLAEDPHAGIATDPHAGLAIDPHGGGGDPHGGGGDPHAGIPGAGRGEPDLYRAPPDTAEPSPEVPKGEVVVDLRDADDNPVPQRLVGLGILKQSIARGDSHDRKSAMTDGNGRARFVGLETETSIAYRASVESEGATFSAPPFSLDAKSESGVRVVLHLFKVTHDIKATLIATETFLQAEVKDDRILVGQLLRVYNVGRLAWVPEELVLPLPQEFMAFNATDSMSGQKVEEVKGVGVRLRGTFGPGQHELEYHWQLPYASDPEVTLEVGIPPHLLGATVRAPANPGMRLEVAGFPPAESDQDGQGGRLLSTQRRFRPDETTKALRVDIKGLPSPGVARLFVALASALVLAVGLTTAVRRRPSKETVEEHRREVQRALLDELAELERARTRGDVGPKAYERIHRQLIDALALQLAKGSEVAPT
jgi:hypothetical protein